MIRTATRENWPELKQLWQLCFGDSRPYIDFIFANLLRPECILVLLDKENQPVSMLCFEPFELCAPPTPVRGAYIFGVATAPDQQGKGLSTKLLQNAHRYLHGKGFAMSCLVPATPALFAFYQKRGYQTAFSRQQLVILPEQLGSRPPKPYALIARPLQQLAGLRDRHFGSSGLYVRWSGDYLRYIGDECRLLGGEVLRIELQGVPGYAVCYRRADKVVIKELAVAEAVLPDALAALHSRYRAGEYLLALRADVKTPYQGSTLPFAMLKWYDKNKLDPLVLEKLPPPYIAHVLD